MRGDIFPHNLQADFDFRWLCCGLTKYWGWRNNWVKINWDEVKVKCTCWETYKVGFYPKSNAGKCPNKMAKLENLQNIKACTCTHCFNGARVKGICISKRWEGGTVGSPRGVGEWGDYDPNILTGIIE